MRLNKLRSHVRAEICVEWHPVFYMSRIAFILLILPFWCCAARPYTPRVADPVLESWRWRQIQDFNGLGVRCVDEDQDGTLWFGCVGGIVQYDGMQMRRIPFDKELLAQIDSDMPCPPTHALLVTRDNRRLMVISSSLVCQSAAGWEVVVDKLGSEGREVALKQDADGVFWLLTDRKCLRISEDFGDVDPVIIAKKQEALLAFCLDPSGNIWVVKRTGRNQAADLIYIPVENGRPQGQKKWEVYRLGVDSAGDEAALEVGPAGKIWYVDNRDSNDIVSFDPHRKRWQQMGHPDSKQAYTSLMKDHNGTLWACGRGQLFAIRKDPGFYDSSVLGLPTVPLTLFEASDQRLWVISRSGQVFLMGRGGERWKTYERLHFECESTAGVQWFIKSDGGVVSHDSSTGKWLQYGVTDGLINRPLSLTASSHGLIWAVGSHDDAAAISVFDGRQWTLYRHPELSETIGRDAVLEASDGTMWFGAVGRLSAGRNDSGGALQYGVSEKGEVKLLKRCGGTELAPRIRCFAQTPDGKIWIGSPDIKCFDPISGEVQPAEELPLTGTLALILDGSQTLWALKAAFGLFQKEAEGWQYHTPEDGLLTGMITDIVPLQDGTMLISTEDGVFRYDGQVWVRWAIPGFSSMVEQGGGLVQAGDGSIWFNFNLSEHRPARIVQNKKGSFFTVRYVADTYPPETSIRGTVKKVAPPGNATFSWVGQDRWGDTPIGDLQYSWRLNGGQWSPFSYTTEHNFINLVAGQCVLEVRARDRDLNTDPTPARLQFVVIPSVWKQGWFILMVVSFVGMVLGLLWLMIRAHDRHVQQQQQQREKHLVELDRLKTGFFTNISHELRTPMTVISGRLESMMDAEPDPSKHASLTVLMRNAMRISTLIAQLLDFRKIAAGKLAVHVTPGDLIPKVREWMSALQPLADDADVALSLEGMESCPGEFDFDKIQKILTNLITNAIKYTPAGGAIYVMLRVPPDEAENEQLEIIVEDSGVGIAQEHLAHIFDRFYRVSEASVAAGAGIGLNLTKELVGLLGGRIRAESPVHPGCDNPGTRFAVRLPVSQQAVCGREPCAEAQPSAVLCDTNPPGVAADAGGELPLILVVEDDRDILDFIAEGLLDDYRVKTAKDGAEGLALAKELVPDLVVTDLMMPVMDGAALCRELKASLETSHVPVVMLTAKASVECQLEGLKTGADDYITKPFHMALLQARIANLLQSRRKLREAFCATYPELFPGILENKENHEFLQKVIQVLEEHYSEWEFTVEEFATELHMSRSSIFRKLKAETDRTPNDFLNEFRMMKAAELLLSTSKTVTEISFKVGCQEPTNFARLFKRYHKISPSQYRAAHQTS